MYKLRVYNKSKGGPNRDASLGLCAQVRSPYPVDGREAVAEPAAAGHSPDWVDAWPVAGFCNGALFQPPFQDQLCEIAATASDSHSSALALGSL